MKMMILTASIASIMVGMIGCPFFNWLFVIALIIGALWSIYQAAILINNDSPD